MIKRFYYSRDKKRGLAKAKLLFFDLGQESQEDFGRKKVWVLKSQTFL